MKRKFLSGFLAAAMVLNLTGLPVLAAGTSYEDGTWSGTATVQPDVDEDFDAYPITLNVQVTDGQISDISLDSSVGLTKNNAKYFNRAANSIYAQIIANGSTEGIDAVSTATCSSAAILEAVNNALAGHEAAAEGEETTDPTEEDPSGIETGGTETEDPSDSGSEEKGDETSDSDDTKDDIDDSEEEASIVYYEMNIPFSVFYSDITPTVASSIDAVTTATTKGKAAEYISNGNFYGPNDNEIDGVTIPVAMTAETYETVKNLAASDTADYYIGAEVSSPDVYLTLTYENGYNFSELTGSESTGDTIGITYEWQTKRRDIEIDLETELGLTAADLYGGYVTATDGTTYPLLPMETMYKASSLYTIGWSLGDKTEQRNSSDALVMTLQPDLFASMKGKTLDSMTVFTTEGIVTYALRDAETDDAVAMVYPSEEEEEEETSEEVYVLMNIPYSEFYAAEGTTDVDAVTSATKTKTRTGSLAGGSYHVNSDGTDITGITYPVKVSDASVLEGLKQVTDEDSYDITVTNRGTESTTTYAGKDALFENETYAYYILSEEPAYYKELTVNEDGSFSFGEAKGTETSVTASAELLSGADTSYGDYEIDMIDYQPETIYGAVLHTAEGGTYGLKHVENMWRNYELAIGTGHTTSVHGCPIQSYEEAEGQTVTSITFYTDNGIETVTLSEALYLAPILELTAEAEDANTVKIDGLAADMENAKASVTYTEGSGRNAVTYTVEEDLTITDGTITLSEALSEDTAYTVTVTSDNYAPATASFTYTAAADEEEEEVYVLMNIPYSEFYAAEGTTDVDAVTSATKTKTRTGSLAGGSYHVNSDGTDITGITYPVKVSDASVLEGLKQVTDEDSYDITVTNRGTESTTTYAGKDALFENETYAYYILSEEPAYYKELTVNEDGSFSFGEAKGTETSVTASAELLSGADTSYGDYEIDMIDYQPETIYGAVLHTAEGGTYGLKHVENMWRNYELAIGTGHTTSVHGCPIQSYEEAEGQTVTSITFYTDNGIENVTLSEGLYLAPILELSAEAEDANTVKIKGLADDMENAEAAVTYTEGSGRGAVTYTLEDGLTITDGTITLSEALSEDTAYTVTVTSDNYAPAAASFTYTAASDSDDDSDNDDDENVDYTIIEGAAGTWTKGSEDGYKVVSDAPFDKFAEVQVDGETVDSDNYAAASGSTEVTFTAGYLETLSVGEHTVTVVSSDGSASTTLTIAEADDSGDDSTDDTKKDDSTDDTAADDTSSSSGSGTTAGTSSGSSSSTGTSASKGSSSSSGTSASASKSGSSSTSGTVNTGDTAPVQAAVYGVIFAIAAAAAALLIRFRRKM